jgi:hypothetical protein
VLRTRTRLPAAIHDCEPAAGVLVLPIVFAEMPATASVIDGGTCVPAGLMYFVAGHQPGYLLLGVADNDVPEDQQIVRFADGTGVSQRSYSAEQDGGDGETPLLMASLRGEPLDMSPEARKAAGISEGLVRIAVGLENSDDLIRDLQGGLKK